VRLAPALARAVALAALVLCARVQAAPADGLTQALRLEVLTERIAKLHAQVGQGMLGGRSRRDLSQALRDMDATLAALDATPQDPELHDNYALLAILGAGYREWASRPPTRESARKLRGRAEELAWVAARRSRLVQERSRGTARASVVRSMNAAAMAQRVAKARLWMRWEMGDAALAKELRESNENLRRLLATLREGSAQAPEAAEALQAAESQLGFMDDAQRELDAKGPAARPTEFVAKAADFIEDSMERAAAAYAAAR